MPRPLSFDVTGQVPIEGEHRIAAWAFPPTVQQERTPLLLCLPGGSYTKAYWHLEVPGRSGYSFGEHLSAAGMLVVAVDHLATGESSRHPRAAELTPDVVSKANSAALAQIVTRVAEGRLVEGLGPLDLGPIVAVGHSMGAMLAIFQQSLYGGFDGLALLGYGVVGPFAKAQGIGAPSYESIMGPAREGALDEPFLADRKPLQHHFYWEDVPADVIAADELTNTPLPGVTGPLSIVPFIATDHAGRIECPVFLGLGERDSTTGHHEEPRAYTACRDLSLFVLPGSAHCHNTATTRQLLWNRLVRWIDDLRSGEAGGA